jgi:AraC-like DNA-binding protein
LKVLRISKEVELLIGSIGAVQSIFMSAYLFFGKKRSIPNILLGLFFLLITLRIVKSLLWVYLDFIPDWFINLGFAAHIASGPTLLLYLLYFLFPKTWNRLNYFHFIPAILLILFLYQINESNFWYKGGYAFLLYHQLTYTICAIVILIFGLFKFRENFNLKNKMWLTLIMLGATSIQLAYFSNYILGITPYLAGPIVYAVFIYIIAFYGLLNHKIFDKENYNSKYDNINISSEGFMEYKSRIEYIMQSEKPYLDPAFNLQNLSKQISLPSYLTSHIINKGCNTNFSDFINSYRIDIAKSKLNSQSYRNIKIAEIAYECGFNSLSSFNTSFKKQVGVTPSQFRKNSI